MSVDLSTRYLGFPLASPLVASASPLTGSLEGLHQLAEAGAGAVVLPSLFEEQLAREELALYHVQEHGAEAFAEAQSFLPELETYNTGPDRYLELVRAARQELKIPVVASLNGSSLGGWVRFARRIEDAGASALELNIYIVPTALGESGSEVETRYLDLVAAVRRAVRLPLAVKVGPGFSAPAHMAQRLIEVGADGLVLFNRFLLPDVDFDGLRLAPRLVLSTPPESRLPLQWIGLLFGRVPGSLAASSGVHGWEEVAKLLLVGADVVMATSSLLQRGPGHLRVLQAGLERWMQENAYASVQQLRGSLSHQNCPDPTAYERANYMRTIATFGAKWP